MWFCRKKTLEQRGIFAGFTDWHCHILPGVDDGVPTIEESLQILAEYERMGVKEVWLTPHIMEEIPNSTCDLRARFDEFKSAYHGSIELNLASENMLDGLFEERLESGDLLPIGREGSHLLVETSYFNPPMGLYSLLERIKSKGYHPVLAHPERYLYMTKEDYRKLKSMNVRFQLNLFSLLGHYGKTAQKNANELQKSGFYEFTGTDLHRLKSLQSALTKKV